MTKSILNSTKLLESIFVKVIKYTALMYNTVKILCVFLMMLTFSSSTVYADSVLDDPENLSVSVYPNPSSGNFLKITIGQNTATQVEIKIYTALGDVIHTETYNLSSSTQTLTLTPSAKLKEGIYMISVKTSEAQITRRIIVRN